VFTERFGFVSAFMIQIKTPEEIEIMRQGGKKLAAILAQVSVAVRPGIVTKELDNLAEKLIKEAGGSPSFKGYNGFSATICTSINEEVVHGIPSDRILREGDLLSIDVGMQYLGFHTDMAVTVAAGEVSHEALRLLHAAKKALKRGIKKAKVGNTFGDISNTIQRYVEDQGFAVVRDLCGHGIGRDLHEDPQIMNFGKRHKGEKIKEGMVFCIEPMITNGSWEVVKAKNQLTFITKDKSISAHFEHTLAIYPDGKAHILTL
jgi:methionyl aminopeptidase